MRYILIILCLCTTIQLFSQYKKDSTEIMQLLKADYKTLVTNDVKTHRANCTDDYLLIEDGEIWNMEKEAAYYKQNEKRVIEREDHFDLNYMKILDNTAYVVYKLRSDITENSKLIQKNWNESVIFRKVDGKWRIALIHSTKNDTVQSNPLNGSWKPVREEFGGSELPPASFEKQKLTIIDSNYTFIAESVDKGIARYKDGKMDIYGKDGVNSGKHITAIYKFENDLLIICYNLSGDKYPEAFETKGNPTYFLTTFKKE